MLLITCVAYIPQNSEIKTDAASLGSSGNNTIQHLSDLPIHQARFCRPHLLLVLLCDSDNEEKLSGCLHRNHDITEFCIPTLHWPHLYLIRQDYQNGE